MPMRSETSTPEGANRHRPPLQIFSPLPPTRSGIADYCQEQLPLLARDWDVTVVVGNEQRQTGSACNGVRTCTLNQFRQQPLRGRRLYHLGNNPHHAYVLAELRRTPGVLVLHDYVQHHLITEMTLGRGDQAGYREFLEIDAGELGGRLADDRSRGIWNENFSFLLPANGAAVEAAEQVIVHSEWARTSLRSRFPDKPVVRVPHHYSDSPASPGVFDRRSARRHLKLDESATHIVSLGFITRPKQVELALAAMGAVRDRLGHFHYTLVGEPQDLRALRRCIRQHGLDNHVSVTGYVDLATLQDYILAADVIVNLRYPSAGETSGTLVRALGQGRCAVVFDYGSFTDFPEDVACKIPLETTHTRHLEDTLVDLIRDPDRRHGYEVRARDYIRRHHDLVACVAAYNAVLADRPAASHCSR